MPSNAKNSALGGDVIFSQSQATATADTAQARTSSSPRFVLIINSSEETSAFYCDESYLLIDHYPPPQAPLLRAGQKSIQPPNSVPH